MLNVDINQGNVQPMPIAVPDFVAGGATETDVAHNVTGIIAGNLQRSGLFAPINPQAFVEKIGNSDAVPRFPDWRAINAQALVTGRITRQSDGRLRAEFRLWDVFAGQQLAGQQYFTSPDNWRRIAHIISDAIYERLTGEKGYFDSRIVFVDETGPKPQRVKRLAIHGSGRRRRALSDARRRPGADRRVSIPRRRKSPTCSYGQGDPRVYLLNIETGQREIVGNFPRHDVCPRIFAGRPARDHEPAAGRQLQPVRHGSPLEGDDAADRRAGDRHLALLFAGRFAHLLRE